MAWIHFFTNYINYKFIYKIFNNPQYCVYFYIDEQYKYCRIFSCLKINSQLNTPIKPFMELQCERTVSQQKHMMHQNNIKKYISYLIYLKKSIGNVYQIKFNELQFKKMAQIVFQNSQQVQIMKKYHKQLTYKFQSIEKIIDFLQHLYPIDKEYLQAFIEQQKIKQKNNINIRMLNRRLLKRKYVSFKDPVGRIRFGNMSKKFKQSIKKQKRSIIIAKKMKRNQVQIAQQIQSQQANNQISSNQLNSSKIQIKDNYQLQNQAKHHQNIPLQLKYSFKIPAKIPIKKNNNIQNSIPYYENPIRLKIKISLNSEKRLNKYIDKILLPINSLLCYQKIKQKV